MQIMPSSWANPAALNQQALGDSKHGSAPKNSEVGTEPVNPLEESGKTGDRDANERYDGPQQSGTATGKEATASAIQSESMLSLPAGDGEDATTLDLLG
ncbi:MAG: hypothetical protein NTY15_19530 [Planctomycetota bacterium]|nr:hypothetical protein [Planctomycetota bacterium]